MDSVENQPDETTLAFQRSVEETNLIKIRRRIFRDGLKAVVSVSSILCTVTIANGADEADTLVIQRGCLFDPVAGAMLTDRTIVVSSGRIKSVIGSNEAFDVPAGTRIIDARELFIVPGLIDAHVHLVHLADKSHVTGDQILPMFLAAGVTSLRDAGDAIVAESVIAHYADSRPELCPRVFLASPLIDGDPPFHRDVGQALTDPKNVASLVEDMAAWNVTTLKLYVGTPRVIGREVIREGHKRGMKVTAHLGAYSAQDAVLDGIDSLEHIWSVFNYSIPPEAAKMPDHRANLDLANPQCQALIAAIAQHKVAVDPTLVVFRNMLYLNDLEEVYQHADLASVPKPMLAYWESYRRGTNLQPNTRESRRKEVQKYQELTGMLHAAGVEILAGTDAPEPYVTPGFSLHQELEMLVESGLSPVAALAAATINNARALGQEQQLGSIEPGKLADLIILEADPTLDIRHSRRIRHVVHGGHLCDPRTLLDAVPR
jgi:imidazolonepropionase-like amidohydrolase